LAYSTEHHGVGERSRVRIMLKRLVGMYAGELAANIAPAELRAIRRDMIGRNWSRSYINDLIDCLTRMFQWLVGESLIPVTTYQTLKVVRGLRRGEGGVRETDPVLPVDDVVVEATLPHLPELVADMVRVQRLTGMRPAEVCILRPCDIERTGEIWLYRPKTHKTQRLGKDRLVPIGPKAQEVLQPYLVRDNDSYCFEPHRKHEHYDVCTYRRAIHRACDKAFPHPDAGTKKVKLRELQQWQSERRWSPNRLRHTAATEIRTKFGLEHAQVVLGHSRMDTTQIYAERDMAKGVAVARELG
jgi:integrase